tara:strand:+ start:1981 stop:3111 length:1131 start_codon:yes stop_codon:yes gene_type:complete
MTFFDPKSDVMNIELTQYGKHLLSKGKWNPSYYAFFDDDILYDSQYGGYTENQNSSQTRITGSARMKTQYNFSGVETEIKKEMAILDELSLTRHLTEQERVGIQATKDRDYALSLPMGRSDIGNENYPAWSITCLNGIFSSSVPYSTSSLGNLPIIQLVTEDIVYKTEVKNKSKEGNNILSLDKTLNQIGESAPEAPPSDLILANKVYEDGTYISIDEDYFLMELLEKNTPFDEENVAIEVFKYELNQQTGAEVLVPLKFMKRKQLVVNDILLDNDDPEMNQYQEPTPDCVEYFFNVWVDDEIDEETLCKAIVQRRNEGLYAPPLKCPEGFLESSRTDGDIYGPPATTDDGDSCTEEPACPAEDDTLAGSNCEDEN